MGAGEIPAEAACSAVIFGIRLLCNPRARLCPLPKRPIPLTLVESGGHAQWTKTSGWDRGKRSGRTLNGRPGRSDGGKRRRGPPAHAQARQQRLRLCERDRDGYAIASIPSPDGRLVTYTWGIADHGRAVRQFPVRSRRPTDRGSPGHRWGGLGARKLPAPGRRGQVVA